MRQTKIETEYMKEWMRLRNRKLCEKRETENEKGRERVRTKRESDKKSVFLFCKRCDSLCG